MEILGQEVGPISVGHTVDALGLRCPGTISHEPNLKFALDTDLLVQEVHRVQA